MQLNKIKKIVNEYTHIYPNIDYLNRINYEDYVIFYKKDDAYQYSNVNGKLPIFSVDISDTDAKKGYCVTGYNKWWKEYSNTSDGNRYAYEVVLPNHPCHLYVDIEVEYISNPKIISTIDSLFNTLIDELRKYMYNTYIAKTDLLDNMEIVILDSSKSSKFSKHLVIKIPQVLFENNYQCGAFIRNFQIHIITKYGGKDVNPFFVLPANKVGGSAEVRQFIIDMGVYTKGRDFRLLGSYKRVGGSMIDEHGVCKRRYIWVQGRKGELTKELFFNSLIQYCGGNTDGVVINDVKYYVGHIVDTINGGVPMSSSLRTVRPKGCMINDIIKYDENEGGLQKYNMNLFKRTTKCTKLTNIILEKIIQKIKTDYSINVTSMNSTGGSLYIFRSLSRRCRVKEMVTNVKGDTHSKNTIFFIFCIPTGILYQSCFNQTYCMNSRTGKHRKKKMFAIRDEQSCIMLQQWCDINGFNWKGECIPQKWMG